LGECSKDSLSLVVHDAKKMDTWKHELEDAN